MRFSATNWLLTIATLGARLLYFGYPLNHPELNVRSAQLSPNSKLVLTASYNNAAALWDAQTGQKIAELHHDSDANSALFSPDGAIILTASADSAKIWETNSARLLATLTQSGVNSAVFNQDGNQVLTSDDGAAKIWDWRNQRAVVSLGHHDEVRTADFSPNGSEVLTTSWTPDSDYNNNNSADLWEVATGKHLAAFCHGSEVGLAAFSPDGKRIVTLSLQVGFCKRWDAASGRLLSILEYDGRCTCFAFSLDGHFILTGNDQGAVKVWNAAACGSTDLIPAPNRRSLS